MSRFERTTIGRAGIVLAFCGLAWLVWTMVPDFLVGTVFADYLYVNQVVAVCVVLGIVERLWSKFARKASDPH